MGIFSVNYPILPAISRILFGNNSGRVARIAILAASLLVLPGVASAQRQGPIPRFAIDARGSLPRFKQEPAVAAPYGLVSEDLPGLGLGLDIGAHVYPLRLRWVTFGLGGSFHVSRAARGLQEIDGTLAGHDVNVRFRALSPQLSFNFGGSGGWSYLSGGLATSTLLYTIDGTPADRETQGRKTINYGGGARWFMKDHLAFSLDFRFYAINPQAADATLGTQFSPRMTLFVISAGVSIK